MPKVETHTITLTTQQVVELRNFVAEACRQQFSTKAARKRMADVCEHVLLRTLLDNPSREKTRYGS